MNTKYSRAGTEAGATDSNLQIFPGPPIFGCAGLRRLCGSWRDASRLSPAALEGPFHTEGTSISVCLGKKCAGAVFAADDAGAAAVALLVQRDGAAGGAGLFPDAGFTRRVAAPVDFGQSATALAFHLAAQRFVIVEGAGLGRHRGARLLQQAGLDFVEQLFGG